MKVFLDDIRNPYDVGLDASEWVVVRRYQDMEDILYHCSHLITDVSLDHDLGDPIAREANGIFIPKQVEDKRTGYDLTKWMAETNIWPKENVFIHSANPVGAKNMKAIVDRYFYRKGI